MQHANNIRLVYLALALGSAGACASGSSNSQGAAGSPALGSFVGASGHSGSAGSGFASPGPTTMGMAGRAAVPSSGAVPPATGTGGLGSNAGGVLPMAGAAGGGVPSAGNMAGSGGGAGNGGAPVPTPMGKGACCASGDCLCHGPAPTALTSMAGPFKTANYDVSTGTIYYPMDADPPLAAIAIIPGFLNTGPEMAPWGPFYASWGFVLETTSSGAADTPDLRAGELLAAVAEMKSENTKSGSPIFGKLSGRFGTSGYSMGGGGTTIAASMDMTLKTSIGLAPWGGVGTGVTTATLLFCGDADTVAPCNMADGAYTGTPESTPKMEIVIPGATHFNWFDPGDAGGGESGKYALAFQKTFLEGDERWKSYLLMKPSGGTQTTTIK